MEELQELWEQLEPWEQPELQEMWEQPELQELWEQPGVMGAMGVAGGTGAMGAAGDVRATGAAGAMGVKGGTARHVAYIFFSRLLLSCRKSFLISHLEFIGFDSFVSLLQLPNKPFTICIPCNLCHIPFAMHHTDPCFVSQ